ncbi:MAG: hypothetical protein HC923_03735 [Myxococcales bacterium]|nr:hypothetical protein [Myxococcales bacterium]
MRTELSGWSRSRAYRELTRRIEAEVRRLAGLPVPEEPKGELVSRSLTAARR